MRCLQLVSLQEGHVLLLVVHLLFEATDGLSHAGTVSSQVCLGFLPLLIDRLEKFPGKTDDRSDGAGNAALLQQHGLDLALIDDDLFHEIHRLSGKPEDQQALAANS